LRGLLLAGSVALTLLLLEWLIRLVAPQPLNYYNFAMLNERGVVERGAGLWTGGTLYRAEIKPPGQGPMRANRRMRMGEVDIEINAQGWRDRTYPAKPAPRTHRLLFVGDSVTFGYGVPLAATYHKRLEDRLNEAGRASGQRFEVMALAGGGGTTYDALRMVRHHLGYFEPQELWLAFNLNDVLYPPYRVGGLPGTAGASRPSSLKDRAILMLAWFRSKADTVLRPRSHLYHLVRQRSKALLRFVGVYSPTLQPEAAFAFSSERAQGAWSATRRAILELRAEAARHRARFAVMVLPADPQTSPSVAALYRSQFQFRFDDDFATGEVQRRICADLRAEDIECVDPLPWFHADADRQLFLRVYGDSVDWNHPNAAGHALLAQALYEAVQARLLSGGVPRPPGN
jgi:lysophospholipase L1-like esterase